MRVVLLCVLALALAGCGGRPEGVLTPVAGTVPGASRVDMLVATTRSNQAAPGDLFSGERGPGLSFADISISIPPDQMRRIGDVQWPSSRTPDPSREFATLRAEQIDQAQALSRFHTRLKQTRHRNVLLFVHGYNTRFDEAVFRLAQISHDTKAPALPLLFTWPSRGQLTAYAYDRESANYSRDALEAVLQALQKDPAVGEISILAHSMGNWVTLEALRQMSIRNGRIGSKIASVMLAAPDVDVDVFRRQIDIIGEKRAPFIVFVSRDDRALALSSRLWGGASRLGSIDPTSEPTRSQLAQSNVQVVDLTTEESLDPTNHGRFANSPQVAQLIGRRLAGGQTLSDGQAGVGESIGLVATGAAGAVGRAASIAVSAPISIVDGRTREGLGEQFRDLGGQIGGTVGSAARAVPLR